MKGRCGISMWSLDSTRVDVLTHIVLTIYILVGIIFEERKLVKQHGSFYPRRSNVRCLYVTEPGRNLGVKRCEMTILWF